VSDLDWLKAANQDWKRRAEIAMGRAESAERFLHAETAERNRLAASRILWRRLTISAWSYFGGYTGVVEWHWTRWTYLGCGLVVGVLTVGAESLDGWRARRRKAGDR
jgi:hypothetical protein